MLNWLLYSNLFIGICAMAYTMQGYYLLQVEPKCDLITALSGVATMFVYLLIRIAATSRLKVYDKEERWHFFLKHIVTMRIIAIVTFFACVVLFFLLPRAIQYVLLLPAGISLLYGVPLPIKGKLFRLRDVGLSKIFMIAFVWAFIGSVLPAVNNNIAMFAPTTLILFAANFLFIFAITIPFDIKDLKIDAMHNVKTIPTILGVENSYNLAFLSLFISGILHVYLQRDLLSFDSYVLPITISIIISGWTIFLTRKKNANVVYFGLLDGMLILQFALIAFTSLRS